MSPKMGNYRNFRFYITAGHDNKPAKPKCYFIILCSLHKGISVTCVVDSAKSESKCNLDNLRQKI